MINKQQNQEEDVIAEEQLLSSMILSHGAVISSFNDQEFYQQQQSLVKKLLKESKGSVIEAYKIFTSYLEARRNYIPTITRVQYIENIDRKVYFVGQNKQGLPCMIVKIQNIDQTMAPEDKVRMMFYIVDLSIAKMIETNTQAVCVIWDREGYVRSRHYDAQFHELMKPMFNKLGAYCQESIGAIYVTHINAFFRFMFAIGKKVQSKQVFDKIFLVDEPKNLSTYFDSDNLKLMGYIRQQ